MRLWPPWTGETDPSLFHFGKKKWASSSARSPLLYFRCLLPDVFSGFCFYEQPHLHLLAMMAKSNEERIGCHTGRPIHNTHETIHVAIAGPLHGLSATKMYRIQQAAAGVYMSSSYLRNTPADNGVVPWWTNLVYSSFVVLIFLSVVKCKQSCRTYQVLVIHLALGVPCTSRASKTSAAPWFVESRARVKTLPSYLSYINLQTNYRYLDRTGERCALTHT